MTFFPKYARIMRYIRDESGAAMVEFAMVSGVFFLLVFQVIDFGMFASNNLMSEKAAEIAARIATVRPAVCAGVPDRYVRGTASPEPRFGTSCSAVANACAMPLEATCSGVASNPTANEIWTRIAPTLPSAATISDLTFHYTPDPNLGYLGGPYVPIVTVELTLDDYELAFPLRMLARLAGGNAIGSAAQPDFEYRVFSISLPSEDLAAGTTR